MQKHNSIIDINGRRYNAKTGEWVTSGKGNRVAIHLTDEPAPTPAQPAKHPAIARRPARHHASHPPSASHTLMRRAVKKPEPSRKHRLKAHAHTDTLAHRALSEISPKPSARRLDEKRWRHAKHVPKSRLISRFSRAALAASSYVAPAPAPPPHQPQPASQVLTHAQATEAFLERALEQATSYQELPTAKRRHLLRRRRHTGAAAGR